MLLNDLRYKKNRSQRKSFKCFVFENLSQSEHYAFKIKLYCSFVEHWSYAYQKFPNASILLES